MKKACSATDPLWYKDAIIYELHVRAFADSNGDGIGDFQGLISKLDYLQELGVTCLWLLPFFPSPLRDDGYDIANYTDVNPSYGVIDDFKLFLGEAHKRNMQVMIELVINHTSDQHPWFQRARRAPAGSPERNFYVWSDTDQLYKDARIIFTDTEKSNWTWDDMAKQYYWHRFFAHQPDLNFDNPAVMEEVLKAMRFWLDMGVDAMRMDAIPYLVERDGTNCENLEPTHEKIKQIRAAIDAEYENRLVLAEANQWPDDVRPYFGDGDECHMAFHFPLMPRIYMALRQEDRLPITDIMARTPDIPPTCQWGIFLRNHDELTLEMVTDDERDYMYLAYSADPRMRINVGIRRRLAPLVDNNRRRIELLNSLLLSMPGTPIMYYGDEIGMGDNIYLGDRNGVRTPMQWNSDRNAGFSRADPARLYFPVIMDPTYGYQSINVEAQQNDPSSLLQWTKNMLALRKLFQVFGRGTLEFLHPANRKILSYVRDYAPGDGLHSETVLCVANLSRFAQPVSLDLSRYNGRQPVEMLGYVPFPAITDQPYPLTLAPYSFLWLELQPSPASATVPQEDAGAMIDQQLAQHANQPQSVRNIAAMLEGDEISLVLGALPQFLAKQRWFGSKSRVIDNIQLRSAEPVTGTDGALAIVDISYSDGSTETYQLPLAMHRGAAALALESRAPLSVVLALDDGPDRTVLFDATAEESFRARLWQIATQKPGVKAPDSRISSAEQSNTSIIYGSESILKLYRRLQPGENPDVEVSRFLSQQTQFTHTPAYLGQIPGEGNGTLAFLQQFAPNEGDGWDWMNGRLLEFYTRPETTEPTGKNSSERSQLPLSEPLAAARLLGQRTAEMHLALASSSREASFAPEPFSPSDLAADASRIHAQISAGLDALKQNLAAVPQQLIGKATAVLSQRKVLLDRAHELATASPFRAGQRIRIHGDYHLGQTLRTGNDFLIVDFEGEPSKPLDERRRKQSALRDVAGMLRSFSYAAFASLSRYSERDGSQLEQARSKATAWQASASQLFLSEYKTIMQTHPEVLPSAEKFQGLLQGYLLEKALYELLYELNNRPSWLGIPLDGVLGLLGEAA